MPRPQSPCCKADILEVVDQPIECVISDMTEDGSFDFDLKTRKEDDGEEGMLRGFRCSECREWLKDPEDNDLEITEFSVLHEVLNGVKP